MRLSFIALILGLAAMGHSQARDWGFSLDTIHEWDGVTYDGSHPPHPLEDTMISGIRVPIPFGSTPHGLRFLVLIHLILQTFMSVLLPSELPVFLDLLIGHHHRLVYGSTPIAMLR